MNFARTRARRLAAALAAVALGVGAAQAQKPEASRSTSPRPPSNANDCLVWTTNSLLANPYYQVAKNDCDYAIRIEFRYEADAGAGCYGAPSSSNPSSSDKSCGGLLQPHEIRRFAAGTIRHWACRAPSIPRFPDIARDGWCE